MIATLKTGIIFASQSKEVVAPYVLTKIAHYHYYLDQFSINLLATFTADLFLQDDQNKA